MMPQQYCLRWKHHHTNVQNMFAQLLEKERFCDVTLYCSPSFAAQVPNKDTVEPHTIRGVSLRAHRVVLAACSELFGSLLGAHEAHGEPVLVIDGAEPMHVKALLDYMYTGEMNVHHTQLASLLKTAEELRIKGLTDIRWNNKDEPPDCASGAVATTTVPKPVNDTPKEADKKLEKSPEAKKQEVKKQLEAKILKKSPERTLTVNDLQISEPRSLVDERVSVNGGPPPLIKLPIPKSMNTSKRDLSDSESPSPKRQRVVSGTENTEEINCIPKIDTAQIKTECEAHQNPSEQADDQQSIIKQAKTSNERVKEYRKRQKMIKASEMAAENQQSVVKKAKTSNERATEYRERQKLLKASADSADNQQSPTKPAKTSSRRVKDYRERQKLLKANVSSADSQQSDTEQEKTTIDHSKEQRESQKREAAESITDDQHSEREADQWQHGNMDISASRITAEQGLWGEGSSAGSDDEWGDAPADIGSFLDTRLRVDGDNSADEESNDSASQPLASRPASVGSSGPRATPPPHKEPLLSVKREYNMAPVTPASMLGPTLGPKSGPSDPRFSDVIRLNDYLQHGRRPQFWEENYVKRVMEAVRLKELEMKQAAEILGVSYGTLYGRYRDVYGCINRPYRAVRDFWQVKGPSEVLERFQRGEISLDTAASALGVSVANLAAHVADFPSNAAHIESSSEFEPIPIEMEPALRTRATSAQRKLNEKPQLVKIAPKVVKCLNPNGSDDDDGIPASIISADGVEPPPTAAKNAGGKWPSIRVASIDSLRPDPPPPPATHPPPPPAAPASPSQLMRTRPDLTIVAKRTDTHDDT